MNGSDAIRIASANLLDGGLSQDGTAARREQSATALRDWQPHLVLIQELYAPGEELVRRHFRALANATGLEPAALGLPRGSRRLRTGILAGTRTVEILDDGPAPVRDAPFWAEAIVQVRATRRQGRRTDDAQGNRPHAARNTGIRSGRQLQRLCGHFQDPA